MTDGYTKFKLYGCLGVFINNILLLPNWTSVNTRLEHGHSSLFKNIIS